MPSRAMLAKADIQKLEIQVLVFELRRKVTELGIRQCLDYSAAGVVALIVALLRSQQMR